MLKNKISFLEELQGISRQSILKQIENIENNIKNTHLKEVREEIISAANKGLYSTDISIPIHPEWKNLDKNLVTNSIASVLAEGLELPNRSIKFRDRYWDFSGDYYRFFIHWAV